MEKCEFSPNEDCTPLACLLRSISAVQAGIQEADSASKDFDEQISFHEDDEERAAYEALFIRTRKAPKEILEFSLNARECAYKKMNAIRKSQANST